MGLILNIKFCFVKYIFWQSYCKQKQVLCDFFLLSCHFWGYFIVIEWKQARKLQATLDGGKPKLWLTDRLTDGGEV